MTRIKAIARKECLHILRDRRTLMLIVMMPIMQLTIYGYAINTDVKHLATAVYDEDQTPLSRRLLAAFEQSGYFDVKLRVQTPSELRRAPTRSRSSRCSRSRRRLRTSSPR